MKNNLSKIALILVFLIGLSLLLYPTVSDCWNSFHQTRAIAAYTEQVANLDQERYTQIWEDAKAYNRSLLGRDNAYLLSEAQKAEYERLLDVSGQGIMGCIEIPKINVSLPIYHGTEEPVLQTAVGHLEWTSLPVGGESTHCVLSGHRGLPSAKLFTDLDKLAVGDVFMLRILDETLTYQVDQILIVEPQETDDLQIVEGKDYCTLVTCTPYGINTHRMLVRGHRVENEKEAVRVTADESACTGSCGDRADPPDCCPVPPPQTEEIHVTPAVVRVPIFVGFHRAKFTKTGALHFRKALAVFYGDVLNSLILCSKFSYWNIHLHAYGRAVTNTVNWR